MRRHLLTAIVFGLMAWTWPAPAAETIQRFPPPDFRSGYELPGFPAVDARADWWQYVDVAVLAGALSIVTWLVLYRRSRTAVVMVSAVSLAYFGFFRGGCVCSSSVAFRFESSSPSLTTWPCPG